MRKAIIALCLGVILAACSHEENNSSPKTSESEREVPKQESNKRSTQVNENETQIDTRKTTSWDGEWVFVNNDTLGELHIEQESEQKIRYKLVGSTMNADSSYANAFEGSGVITGDEATFTNEYKEGCGGVMKKRGTMITLTVENESCHTAMVYVNGEYLQAHSIVRQPLLAWVEGEFVLNGIALGDSAAHTKKTVGNPTHAGPDEEGFYEWVHTYPEKDLLVSYTQDRVVESIHTEGDASELTGIASFDGQQYSDGDENTYWYNPENEQVLIVNPTHEGGTERLTYFVSYADENFHYGVENGLITPH